MIADKPGWGDGFSNHTGNEYECVWLFHKIFEVFNISKISQCSTLLDGGDQEFTGKEGSWNCPALPQLWVIHQE